ncbi:MAG: protein-L-isoaspartate(D-aspartate) O-methyltransferase [Gammaproteobacteria bacterium]|jgi:protein-L-isoaspartate(D-aspartate) O-methyltransferase|nr:protein-L-isoaspartate(D-aspartate) O-methyltransferase [Gammaproteobacteria bacterium]
MARALSNFPEGPRLSGIGMTSARTRERLVQRLQEQGIKDQRVIDRIRTVPRHLFMDEALASRAYEDTALPIGFGQTISQPFVVAKMTEALLAGGGIEKVLEIGTGCGYQTAVLSPMVKTIYTLERIDPLLKRARRTLRELRIRNVNFRHDDGNIGWAARAPFDGILLTAAPHSVPQALFDQLRLGGRLIAPVGPEGRQELFRYTKGETRMDRQSLGSVSFVPLVSGLQR